MPRPRGGMPGHNGVRRDVERLAERVERIDQTGTRGVGVIQVQITELAKDLAELKGETNAWQASHERQHSDDVAARTMGRRWMIGSVIAGAAAAGTIIAMLADIVAQVHH